MRRLHRVARGLLVIAAVANAEAVSRASEEPYRIFADSRQYWVGQTYPALVEYNVVVDLIEGGLAVLPALTNRLWCAYVHARGADFRAAGVN